MSTALALHPSVLFISLLTTAALCVVWLMPPAATVPGTVVIASPQPQIGALALSSRYVAWTASPLCSTTNRCIPHTLYLYTRPVDTLRAIASSAYGANGAIYNAHVSDTWLLYLDTGIAGQPPSLIWSLVARSLSGTQTSYVLAHSSSNDAAGLQPDLWVYGHMAAWIGYTRRDGASVTSTLYLTNLQTRQTTVVARINSPFIFVSPRLDATHIIWEQDSFAPDSPQAQVIGTTYPRLHPQVLSGFQMASQPALYDDFVVWKSGPSFAPGRLFIYRWRTHLTTPVAAPLDDQAFSPVVGDGFIAWSSGSAAPLLVATHLTDRTVEVHTLSVTQPHVLYGQPVADGRTLAWSYMLNAGTGARQAPAVGYVVLGTQSS